MGLVSSQLILFACAGPQEIQESETKYTEGVVVQGGANGFRKTKIKILNTCCISTLEILNTL